MAENAEIVWVKSPTFRAFSSNSQVVQITDLGEGMEFIIRFAQVWFDITKETFPAEKVLQGLKQIGASQFVMSPPMKIEEAAIRMKPHTVAGLLVALLTNFHALPVPSQQIVRDAISKLPA